MTTSPSLSHLVSSSLGSELDAGRVPPGVLEHLREQFLEDHEQIRSYFVMIQQEDNDTYPLIIRSLRRLYAIERAQSGDVSWEQWLRNSGYDQAFICWLQQSGSSTALDPPPSQQESPPSPDAEAAAPSSDPSIIQASSAASSPSTCVSPLGSSTTLIIPGFGPIRMIDVAGKDSDRLLSHQRSSPTPAPSSSRQEPPSSPAAGEGAPSFALLESLRVESPAVSSPNPSVVPSCPTSSSPPTHPPSLAVSSPPVIIRIRGSVTRNLRELDDATGNPRFSSPAWDPEHFVHVWALCESVRNDLRLLSPDAQRTLRMDHPGYDRAKAAQTVANVEALLGATTRRVRGILPGPPDFERCVDLVRAVREITTAFCKRRFVKQTPAARGLPSALFVPRHIAWLDTTPEYRVILQLYEVLLAEPISSQIPPYVSVPVRTLTDAAAAVSAAHRGPRLPSSNRSSAVAAYARHVRAFLGRPPLPPSQPGASSPPPPSSAADQGPPVADRSPTAGSGSLPSSSPPPPPQSGSSTPPPSSSAVDQGPPVADR